MSVKILASVRDGAEAGLALAAGAHVIDLKEPSSGALGAVPIDMVRAVVKQIDGHALVSATIGDHALVPDIILEACTAWSATGVDFIKIGIFPGDLPGTLKVLAPLIAAGIKIIAVVFADGQIMWQQVLTPVAEAGFAGIMLDTGDKTNGGLLTHLPVSVCGAFVKAARDHNLICGLAGSLTLKDIPILAPLGPDYLGFRGALCDGGRSGTLSEARVRSVISTLVS